MKKILSIILVFSLLISGAFSIVSHACGIWGGAADTMRDTEKDYNENPYPTNVGFYAYPVRSGKITTADGQVFISEVSHFNLIIYNVRKDHIDGFLEFHWRIYNEDKSIELYHAPVMTFLYGLNDEIKTSDAIIDTTEYYRNGFDKATHIYSYEDWANLIRENYVLSYNGNRLFTVPTIHEGDYPNAGFKDNISDELLLEIFQLAAYSYMFKPVPRGDVFAEKSMITLR